jgi:D-arabinose 1-dehydrogenase-like Zn-dependent alcohol dehydrogenase
MMTRLLYTDGKGQFLETSWGKEPITDDEIEVVTVMTGVCRSDVDMMNGKFPVLPMHMMGHEGIGRVIKVGANITDVRRGDYVATRGEPAYADFYTVKKDEYVKIPEPHPRYILEPVACGINVIEQAINEIKDRQGNDKKLIILGSGFLAYVAYQRLKLLNLNFEVDVLGANNMELWGDKLLLGTTDSYDVVIDLSGKYALGTDINLNNNALIIDAVGKAVSQEEAQQQLWKACTSIKPSPRNPNFYQCMKDALWMIENEHLNVDSFWTKSYARDTEWQQAFIDANNRPEGYSRGYIVWKY